MNYWDSYVVFSNMVDAWKKEGVKKIPHAVAIPHSLGYRKLLSLLVEKTEKSIVKAIEAGKVDKNSNIDKVIQIALEKNLEKLMDDPKFTFPARILSERLMFASSHVKGCVNSSVELEKQLLTGPYISHSDKYPSVSENRKNLNVITPGIDTKKFGIENIEDPQMKLQFLSHETFAKDLLDKRINVDIAKERKDLPVVLALGRLNKDKNFHGLAEAFKQNKELCERANLVFVINGSNSGNNYIHEMQTLLKQHGEQAVMSGKVKLDKFEGSNLEQLVYLSKILDVPEMKGKWISVSLPNGNDYAGLQRYLGKKSQAVSGLYSFEEPYGLAPFETASCGIPVAVSKGSGAAKELINAGAISFNPHIPSEIADALNKTFQNFDKIRTTQLGYARTKGWNEVAQKYMKIMNSAGEENFLDIDKINSIPVKTDDVTFVNDGKELLRKSVKNEIEIGKFEPLKEHVRDLLKK
jgi:glycosyltransferase involved in cell wall biosynthesis